MKFVSGVHSITHSIVFDIVIDLMMYILFCFPFPFGRQKEVKSSPDCSGTKKPQLTQSPIFLPIFRNMANSRNSRHAAAVRLGTICLYSDAVDLLLRVED